MMAASPSSPKSDRSVSPPPLKKRKYESTTTNQAVKSFFTPSSKKTPDPVVWRVAKDTLLIGNYHPPTEKTTTTVEGEKQYKVAAFDLDSTLIKSRTGKVYSTDADDWQWLHLSVPITIRQLHADGYTIVILTNQGRISLRSDPKTPKADQKMLTMFKTKVGSVLSQFDFPIRIFAATGRDIYRKPRAGMWKQMLDEMEVGEGRIDLDASIFVGDAGGRAGSGDNKKDHACSDRDLAANVGIDFRTPEEYFLKEDVKPFTREFDPKLFLSEAAVTMNTTPIMFEKKNKVDIVIMCGSPGCGKSTFYWTKLKPLGYERVNQDTLKTREKCLKVASSFLDTKTSVTVDNTNADTETRGVWVQLANKYKVPIRCVHFTASASLCEHNDTVRALAGASFNPESRTILPHSAFHSFKARFKEPKVKEGFQDIVTIEFQYQGDDVGKLVWSQYWI